MNDLRSEIELEDAEREALLTAFGRDWRGATLDDADRALCDYAEKLTRTPAAMGEEDVVALRGHGFSDHEIHDAVQVISYFNYINRVADAVHVDLDPGMTPYPTDDGSPA